jgi:hypothetical protein
LQRGCEGCERQPVGVVKEEKKEPAVWVLLAATREKFVTTAATGGGGGQVLRSLRECELAAAVVMSLHSTLERGCELAPFFFQVSVVRSPLRQMPRIERREKVPKKKIAIYDARQTVLVSTHLQ